MALTIDWQGPPTKLLSVRGTAEFEIVEGVPAEFLKALAKAMNEAQFAAFEPQVRLTYQAIARISIVPVRARMYDFGAGRVPDFLRKLGEEQA